MKKVFIIETDTGSVVATIPVVLQGINYNPSEQEYFSQAWECAVEDGRVEKNSRAKYSFKLAGSQ